MAMSIFALLLFISATHGSGVQLSSDPKIIQTILTQDMQMSCSFNDTTGGDLRFVTSLVIIRNGVEIASITPFAPVYAPADAGKMNASGIVSSQHGAQGHLELTWTYPDSGQSGNYTCEVNGVNSVGHTIKYTADLSIPVREPTLADITDFVSGQQKVLDKHHEDNRVLLIENAKNKNDLIVLQTAMKAEKQRMAQVESASALVKTKMDFVMDLMNETRKVENGTAVCGPSSGWTDVGTYLETNVTMAFNKSYSNPPVVHVSPNHLSNYNSNSNSKDNLKYWLDLTDINEYNFTLRCRTDGVVSSSYLRIEELDVSWFSIGSYL